MLMPAPKQRRIEGMASVSAMTRWNLEAAVDKSVEAVAQSQPWKNPWNPWTNPAQSQSRGSRGQIRGSRGSRGSRGHLADQAVLICNTCDELLSPEAKNYKGMAVPRCQNWNHLQGAIDHAFELGILGREQGLKEFVPIHRSSCPSAEEVSIDFDDLGERLQASASKLWEPMLEFVGRVPGMENLAAQFQADAVELGSVVARMVPQAKGLIVALELMQLNRCYRFHQDNYVGRAICSYNGGDNAATEYIHDAYVDFHQLRNGGTNDQILVEEDQKHLRNVGVGNILFMKGIKYPTEPKALVHRSPPIMRREDGSVETRLVLKVDVNDLVTP